MGLYFNPGNESFKQAVRSKIYVDFAFIPRADSGNKPAMVIELKWDKTADTVIRQIKEKRYVGNLQGYSKEIYFVAITYDKDTKLHSCEIEVI